MIEHVLKEIKALLDSRASAPVLHEHLKLLSAQVTQLQRENEHLKAELEQVKSKAQDEALKLRRFENTNPNGWACSHCGSIDLLRTGDRPSPSGFGELGLREAIMKCRVCTQASYFELPLTN